MKIAILSVTALLLSPALYAADAQSSGAPGNEPATMPAAQTPTGDQNQTATPATTGSVARAVFTHGIENHEPTDTISQLNNNENRIYYFSELKGLSGHKVVHRWEHDGQVMAEVPFEVGGDRWRVYSSKTLDPHWLGEWKVSVVDDTGATLSVNTFTYNAAPKQEAAPTTGSTPPSAPTPTQQ